MSDVITRPPTLRALRAAAARALGPAALDVSRSRTPFARLVRLTLLGRDGDPVPAGRLLPRPHEHLWTVQDHLALERFERELRDLVRPALQARAAGDSSPSGPPLRRADPCPWAPCGEHRRPVRFGGLDPDDLSLWAGDALELTADLLRSLRGPTREEAARSTGLRPDLTGVLCDAVGAGWQLTVPQFLTLIALAPLDDLRPDTHVEACRQVTRWWNGADPDLRALLVVRDGAAQVVPEAQFPAFPQFRESPGGSRLHVVELETPLRGLAHHQTGS